MSGAGSAHNTPLNTDEVDRRNDDVAALADWMRGIHDTWPDEWPDDESDDEGDAADELQTAREWRP